MLIRARIVAAIGVLDLDDFGAEIGERLRTSGPGNDPGEIHHQQAIEGGRHVFAARCALRQYRSSGHSVCPDDVEGPTIDSPIPQKCAIDPGAWMPRSRI